MTVLAATRCQLCPTLWSAWWSDFWSKFVLSDFDAYVVPSDSANIHNTFNDIFQPWMSVLGSNRAFISAISHPGCRPCSCGRMVVRCWWVSWVGFLVPSLDIGLSPEEPGARTDGAQSVGNMILMAVPGFFEVTISTSPSRGNHGWRFTARIQVVGDSLCIDTIGCWFGMSFSHGIATGPTRGNHG